MNSFSLSSILEGVLFNAQAGQITEAFLWSLGFLFITALVLPLLGIGRRLVRDTPTLLTSLGILGTFAGIVVGLMHFDPQNIDGSIANLLSGLKTAFVTSLAGMGSAILFKILLTTPLGAIKQPKDDTTGAGPEEILKALFDQRQAVEDLRSAITGAEETSLVGQLKLARSDQGDQHRETLKAFADFKAAISGSEETSLVGQFKLLRSDIHDQHREVLRGREEDREQLRLLTAELWQKLDAFAEMLSKSATEQVINALKEVIIDFNNNLTEQFGENFKALDASVKKLVDWQENYRQQMTQVAQLLGYGAQALGKTQTAVTEISTHTKEIPQSMEKLRAVMLVNQHQLSQLQQHLKAFAEMRDKAVAAVPEIRTQVQKTVDDVAASVKAANDHYVGLLDKSDVYIKAHDEKTHELLGRLTQTTESGIEKIKVGFETGATSIGESLKNQAVTLSEQVGTTLDKTSATFQQSIESANHHYQGLLDQSDAYIKAHDEKTHDLLNRLVKTTDEGLEKIQKGLASGASAIDQALRQNADEFAKQVAELLKQTTTKVEESVQTAAEHYRKLLDSSDAHIKKHDQQSRELLDSFVATTKEGIGKVKDGLESSASAVKTAILTGAEDFDNNVQRLNGNLTKTSDQIATQSDQIRQQLQDTFSEVNNHVRVMLATLSDESKGLSTTLKATGEQVQRDTQVTQKQVAESISQMQARLQSALEESFTVQASTMSKAMHGLEDHMQKAVGRTGESVNEQLSAIDQAMQKEIERVMNQMGRALAQISGQFTNDYTKLVSAMGAILSESDRFVGQAGVNT